MIGVLVVDDSPVVRQLLQELLAGSGDIEVIATASDPIFAMRKMRQRWPDVIVLDIQMPRMDGITFLKQIMAIRPTPVIICSMLTDGGAALGMEALAAGAVGIITKPALGVRDFLHDSVSHLANAIRAADATRHGAVPRAPQATPPPVPRATDSGARHSADAVLAAPAASDAGHPATCPIVAIGASTGGPQALEAVLSVLTPRCPGIVVVQHMPPHFTGSFAQRLDSLCAVHVREARHLDRVRPGQVLIAPGGMHVMLRRDGLQYYVEVVGGPLVSRHKPSVDVLFRSVAKAAGANAVGIIMTGMGDDGARGLKEMAERGAVTYAQDESSSVVFGMPKEAIQLGGVGGVISLAHISAVIEDYGYREPE